jgi:hypothetical protein
MSKLHHITFVAQLALAPEEVRAADGDLVAAVQREIGASGAVVVSIEEHTPPTRPGGRS